MYGVRMVDNETAAEKAVISIIILYTYMRRPTSVKPYHPCDRVVVGCYYTGWADCILHLVGAQTTKAKESSERSPRSFSENVSSFILTRPIQTPAFGCL